MTSGPYPAVAAGGAAVQHKETMMDDEGLKSCPFCGGTGEIKWADGGSAMNWVQCKSCGAKGPWGRIGHDGSGVRNWNSRADLAAIDATADAAKRHDAEVRANERERIASIVAGWRNDVPMTGKECAAAIRALIDKEPGHD